MLRKILMPAALLLCAANVRADDTEDIGALPLPSPQVLAQIVVITPAVVFDFQAIASPGNPSSGKGRLYFDSGSQLLTCLTSVGGSCMPSGGGGGVSSFSAGNLSPLFTTSVATPTSTPALSFTLSNAGANTVFGNFTGGSAAPTFTAAPTFSAANLTNFPTFNQNTTGSAGSVANALTMNNSGSGAASGSTFNGSAAVTLSYNTLGAAPTASPTFTGTVTLPTLQANTQINAGSAGTLAPIVMGNATSGLLTVEPTTGAITSYTLGLPVAQPTSGNTFLSCTAANPAVCTWAAGGGFSNPMTTLGDSIYGGSGGAATRLAGPTTPNGVPQYWTDTPAAGAAVAEAWSLAGVPTNPQTGTTYTFLATDRASYVSFSNGSSIAVTLPQAGSSGFGSNFVTVACDIGTGTATITPTTSNISYTTGSAYTSAASSLALTTGQCAWIYSDNTNYFAILRGSGGSGTVTSIATTSPITGGTITTTGTLACATCVTSAASLTNTELVSGSGGGQGVASANLTGDVTTAGTMATTVVQVEGAAIPASAFFVGTNGSKQLVANQPFAVNPQTATYQVLASDFVGCKTITVASGTFTITLVASGSQPAAGQCINIFNYGSGVVTVARSGQNINGAAANLTLNAGSASAPTSTNIVSDGTNYFATIDEGTVGTVTSIATTGPITGGTITGSGTLACATCVTSAASLTSTAIMTGAGSQGSQTPDATATLSAGGALAGVTLPINDVVSATGAIATIADGNNPLVINCALTSGTTCLTTGETTAATTAGAVEDQITTLTTTTAIPLQITQGANGPANANAPAVLNVSAAAAGGLAGASNAGSVGAPITLLTGAGSAGGATTGIGGAGGAASLTTGAGGAAGGTATNNGGNAGAINLTTGAGGNGGTGAATAGSGGNVVVTLGAPGTNSATGTAGSVGQFQVTGNAPASTANAAGVASGTTFLVSGVTGGASSNAAGTAGVGSIATINGGAGGAGTGTNAVGGAGGAVNLSPGNGGASLGTGVNSNGGSVVATPGAAGTGGSGTAGKAGVLSVAGTTAGAVAFTQGTAVTTSNTNIPANSILEEAPTSVTAYTLTKPGGAPTNNFSTKLTTTGGTESYAKMPQTGMLTSQYTNSTTGFTNVSLSFNMDASTTYQGYCVLYYQAASTGGLNIEFTGPASPTFVTYGLLDPGSATALVSASVATAYSTSLGAVVTTATTNFPATVTFGISNGTTSGTLQLLAKSSAAVQLQIQTGSYCVMQ